MKKFLKNRKAKGFTLVELLIVLIIIGILAGALLLVAGAGTDKANATKIVSNLRSAKAAALMVYADKNGSWTWVDGDTSRDFVKYMDKGTETDKLSITSNGKGVFLMYDGDGVVTTGVADKLSDLAENGVPIYDKADPESTDTPSYATPGDVYMNLFFN
jgi:prepilin-type N-terminal cleavage/methylation domain